MKRTLLALLAALAIAAFTHGLNMMNFPYWENDEGVYVSQAWSWISTGRLSPYTYWYDHAPAGWMLIGMWQGAVFGPFRFGSAVETGRVLMWILHVASAGLMFYIARRLTGKNLPGFLAVVVFSLSPLAIYFQRRVLLDNIATFWILAGIALLVGRKVTLWRVISSGILFAVAVLSKEVAIFFLPAFLYMVWTRSAKTRVWAVMLWLTVAGVLISTYPVYALLKTELVPDSGRVSLLGTLADQLSRGTNLPFWNPGSLFAENLSLWAARDPILIWGGIITLLGGTIFAVWHKALRLPVIAAWCMAVFLLRSKLIIDFYILPILPFIALTYGVLATMGIDFIRKFWAFRKGSVVVVVVLLTVMSFLANDIGQFRKNEADAQRKAIAYIKQTVQPDSIIVADSSLFVDLRTARFDGDPAFPHAEWAWKVERDETVYKQLGGDWRHIDYVILSHEILKQIRDFEADRLQHAIDSADPVVTWTEHSTAYLDLEKYISTNGDWMGVYAVKDADQIILDHTWAYYKKNFVYSYGQIIDPQTNTTTSEGQAYGLLRALWTNDKDAFEGIWSWTRDHLQYRRGDKLLSWQWKDGKLADPATASDADIDTALALLLAGRKWNNSTYTAAGRVMVADIWRKEVVQINGRYVLTAADNAKKDSGYLVNPSYFSPAAYRIFAEVDPTRPWKQLTQDTYSLLSELTNAQTGLVPNWVWLDETRGAAYSASAWTNNESDIYGFDAFRTYWRIALDAQWFQSTQAIDYLKKPAAFFEKEWTTERGWVATYSLSGRPFVTYQSRATTAGGLSALAILKPETAQLVSAAVYPENSRLEPLTYWGDGTNYYDQNWAWFAHGLLSRKLVNYFQ